MGTNWKFTGLVMGMALSLGGSASATPGDVADDHLTITSGQPVRSCGPAGSLCFAPGSRTTVRVASAELSAARSVVEVVPRFGRAAAVASRDDGDRPDKPTTWTLDLSATLARPSLKGNAIVLLYDAERPEAIANREVTVLFQTQVRASRTLTAKLTVSPDDGVEAGHTYRVRVVQLVAGRELVLAEGDVALM